MHVIARTLVTASTLALLTATGFSQAPSKTISSSPTTQNVSGTNPKPQNVSGTNPKPQNVSGTNPKPSGVIGTLLSSLGF